MLDSYIELTINTSARQFEEWFNLYTLTNLPLIIELEEGKILTVVNSSCKMGEHQRTMRFQIQGSISKPEPHEKVEKVLPIPVIEFDVTEFKDNQIYIKFYINGVELYPYLEKLIWEIVYQWPEIKRQATYTFSSSKFREAKMYAILFDFIIETDPKNFIDWCHAELWDSYPGGFKYTFNNQEIITNVGGDFFLPDNFNPFWEYVIVAHDTVFSEDSETEEVTSSKGFSGVIARIEIRHIANDRYQLKCFYGTEHPQIVEWLINFKERLKSIYVPQLKNDEVQISPSFDESDDKDEKKKVLLTDIFDIDQDLDPEGGTYGTNRDMNIDQVRTIVKNCRDFMDRGGKTPEFYRILNLSPGNKFFFELETMRGWLKNPKFTLKDT